MYQYPDIFAKVTESLLEGAFTESIGDCAALGSSEKKRRGRNRKSDASEEGGGWHLMRATKRRIKRLNILSLQRVIQICRATFKSREL